MQVQTATTRPHHANGMSLLWKPVGYPGNQELNNTEVNKWVEQARPGMLKKSTPLTIGGLISTAIGVLTGFVAIGDRKSLLPSLLLLVAGIGSAILGMFGNPIGKGTSLETVKYEPHSLELEATAMGEHLLPHSEPKRHPVSIPPYEPSAARQTQDKIRQAAASSGRALSVYRDGNDPPKAG